MTSLEDFVKQKLKSELKEVQRKNYKSPISVYEQAIVYKYTIDGYDDLNERLRKNKGRSISEYGNLLKASLAKLADHKGLVYRGANLTPAEFKRI